MKHVINFLALVFFLGFPLLSTAHTGGSNATSDLYVPAEIGTEYSKSGVSKNSGGETIDVIREANHNTIDREINRSLLKISVLSILLLITAILVWMRPGSQNNIVRTVRRYSYLTGAMIVSVLLLILITGLIISLWYIPFPGLAYSSAQVIAASGIISYFRNVHYWSSDILMILIIVHLTRVILNKISDKKKLLAYWTGLAMFVIVLNAMLFGTFMRSDQESYEAYAHFWVGTTQYLPTAITNVIMFIGAGDTALLRFFIFHAILFPVALLTLVGLHAVVAMTFRGLISQSSRYVKQVSDNGPAATKRSRNFPQLKKILIASGVLWGIIYILGFFPAPLFSEAYNGLEITKPPWYLLWIYGTENIWGMQAILYAPLMAVVVLFFLPFVSQKSKRFDVAVIGYIIMVIIIIGLSIYAALGGTMSHL